MDAKDRIEASPPTMAASLGRGMLSGVAGTVVMTAFQKYVEMPFTGRRDSYVPAMLTEKVFGLRPNSRRERRRVNYVTHFSLGLMWGAAYGVAAGSGLRGQPAVGAVFGIVYTGDVLLNTALGIYQPSKWSRRDTIVDLVDKLVQAEATGVIFDRFLGRSSGASGAMS